jgi:predicted transcriptional regulator
LTQTRFSHKFDYRTKLLSLILTMEELSSFSDISLRGLLGPLEQKVLDAVWVRGSATVREVVRDGKLWQTYTTIMTTMDRLFRKGLLDRVPEGRAFRYSVKYTPDALKREETMTGIRRLLDSPQASLHLSYLVEAAGAQDARLLDELQSLVERQRAALKEEKS